MSRKPLAGELPPREPFVGETAAYVQALSEETLGPKWARYFEQRWPTYREWFLSEGDAARPSYLACMRALRQHLPELLPIYERAVDLAGGSDLAARCLSGYRPPAFIAGCSQAVFGRPDAAPVLVRNYDYAPALWEAVIVQSRWAGRRVLGMGDCLIGLLDGINEQGLAVSLAFGGRPVVGDGFGMPWILRYVLETCSTCPEAVQALERVPSHMAYNVTVLDACGQHATVFVGPDRPASVTEQRVITNHQHRVEWPRHAVATASMDRLRVLSRHASDPEETEARFLRRFLEPPVYSHGHSRGMGTLYTAVYRPTTRAVSYLWPDHRWDAGIEGTLEGGLALSYDERGRQPQPG